MYEYHPPAITPATPAVTTAAPATTPPAPTPAGGGGAAKDAGAPPGCPACTYRECSKFVGDECTGDTECCYGAKCGTDSICYNECQGIGDYCENDDDCCHRSKCSGGVHPFCYKSAPEAVAAPPLARTVIAGKRVRIQLLSFDPFELLGLLIYDKTGKNVAEAGTAGVSISSYLIEDQAINAITSNEGGCILKQIGSWVEVTLASNTEISAIEIYSKSMADGYDQAPGIVVISIGNESNSIPQKYALMSTIAGSRSQYSYAAGFRDMCTSSNDCINKCGEDEDCKKACGWNMGNGVYDPSMWCAMSKIDRENLSLKICEDQVAAAAATVFDQGAVVAEARQLSTTQLETQCSQDEVPIDISSKRFVPNVLISTVLSHYIILVLSLHQQSHN